MDMDKRYLLAVAALIVGLVAGFLVGRASVSERGASDERDESDTASLEPTALGSDVTREQVGGQYTLVASGNIVHVKDQAAGGAVFLSRVELTQSGWAAVQEVFEGGILGNILGARRFEAGVYQGVVTLLRSTEPGVEYYVVLYADNGDKQFDFKADPVIVDSIGNPASMLFEAY